jgi:hypothetical protein
MQCGSEMRSPYNDLKRMVDGAQQIVSRKQKRGNEGVAAVAWLKAKRDEIGLTALAKIHSANLAKPRRELC